jgi:hypothetical protein
MADYAGHAADARTQVQLSNPTFHLDENRQFFGVDLEVVVGAS